MTKKRETTVLKEIDETDLHAKIKALEEKVAEGEEGAMKRVCAALNIEPEEIQVKEISKAEEPIIRCHVPIDVRINSTVYRGVVDVPLSTYRVIQQAIGDRRTRLLRELTGNNYILQSIADGGYAPKLVGQVDSTGERTA